jgi:hypothetical protein
MCLVVLEMSVVVIPFKQLDLPVGRPGLGDPIVQDKGELPFAGGKELKLAAMLFEVGQSRPPRCRRFGPLASRILGFSRKTNRDSPQSG